MRKVRATERCSKVFREFFLSRKFLSGGEVGEVLILVEGKCRDE